VVLSIKYTQSELSFKIEDEGFGFDYKEIKQKLIDKYYGRGLYFINLYSSEVNVLGCGNTISIKYKCVQSVKRKVLNQESLFNTRILIVDDSAFDVTLSKTIFEKAGFNNIEVAGDGEEGLKKKRYPFNVEKFLEKEAGRAPSAESLLGKALSMFDSNVTNVEDDLSINIVMRC
jgi:hypothetical protein